MISVFMDIRGYPTSPDLPTVDTKLRHAQAYFCDSSMATIICVYWVSKTHEEIYF